jgi:UPF0755 protein
MKWFLVLLGTLLVAGTALGGGFVYDAYLVQPDKDAPAVPFTVAPGENVESIGSRLADGGLINGLFFFKTYVRLSDTGGSFKPGTFELKKGMSYAAIVRELTRSQAEEVQVTIPEGFTLKQIGERVREALPEISEEEWNAAVGGSSSLAANEFVVWAKKPADVDLEGYLFPDTYRFFADATAEEVVTKMVETMAQKVPSSNQQVPNNLQSSISNIHQVLTLASIIEREVQNAEDMKIVAGIFLKRLEIGMPLQADSTISYYLGKTSAELTVEDLKQDEPFNTYTRAGLPPGPISNPGLNAIDAVLHPTESSYLYFLTTSDWTVVYASTFEEHVANKQRYLR